MKSKRTRAIATTAVVLVVLGGSAALAQDRYTLKIPDGLAFSGFRGYETWQVVSVSHPAAADSEMSGEVLNVIVANPVPKYGEQGGHDFDANVIGWALTADPDMYSIWHSTQTKPSENNFIQYKNPELDRALEDSRTQCGQTERKEAFSRANRILNEEQPYNFGFAPSKLLGVSKKVKGVEPGPSRARARPARKPGGSSSSSTLRPP